LSKNQITQLREELKAQSSKPIFSALTFQLSASFGGGERDRTDDLLRARQTLSQLSYTPEKRWWA
jgi:hypothetical protein